MRTLAVALAVIVVALAAGQATVAESVRLSHRVWALGELPSPEQLDALRAVGVVGLVVPVGRVELGQGSSRLTLSALPDAGRLAGWAVTPLVWVEGSGEAAGDAASFVTQLAPVERSLPGARGVTLAARQLAPGIPVFASAVAVSLAGRPVELACAVTELTKLLPATGWKGVLPVALAFGNPTPLGLPVSTFQDDLQALDSLSDRSCAFRVGIPVASQASPAPGPAGGSLAALATGGVSRYRPSNRGDVLLMEKAVDWGGTQLQTGQQVQVEIMDTSRYDRDVAAVLRPVRPGFAGLDTVGLPAGEPVVGMSREALLDYLAGGTPHPRPRIETQWSGNTLRLALSNPTPQASALTTTGNWVEVQPVGAEVGDIVLGGFSGVEYGRVERGVFKRTIAREATIVRFYATFVPPAARLDAGAVVFNNRPQSVAVRWGVRLGSGLDVSGPWLPVGR